MLKYSSVLQGFNSTNKAAGGVSLGENSGCSKYSNNQIIEAVELMVAFPDISLRVLSDTLEISWDTIKQISRGVQYKWLKDVIPETYEQLLSLKGTRASTSNSAKGKGKTYPAIQSPSGEIYCIANVKAFSEVHGLYPSNLLLVLKGTRKSAQGWKLA